MMHPTNSESRTSSPLGETTNPPLPRVNWWLRMTSTGWDIPQETIEQREKVRRSRLTSWILLGMLVTLTAFIPATFTDRASMFSVLFALAGVLVATFCNRKGFVTVAGGILVTLSILATIGVVLGSADGKIHLVYLPAYDIMVISVILGASILPRSAAFIIAVVNTILITADLMVQPLSPDLQQAISQYTMAVIVGRPVAIQIMVAVISFLWVRGMDQAVKRADRAEELRSIEQRFSMVEAERKAQVEEFVQEIINALRLLANSQEGLVVLSPNHPLHQQGMFINNQLKQFYRLKQSGGVTNEQTAYAAKILLTMLQRVNTGHMKPSGLDPRVFATQVPIIDTISWYLYHMLQGKYAPAVSPNSPAHGGL
ncbi:hypothetical protein [Ktedonospora formicarum]|uniref:Uncharacterized protein n=1 Tax=Ktedonospora formicarum TaxID=2778364 RepID=A0A8J3MT64_9CHLR|nr:hypothetical protein [Ktedonospora formicarum]GHO46840.1 hypothetical protein KSX_50030 [Ktedonospora formicarum]